MVCHLMLNRDRMGGGGKYQTGAVLFWEKPLNMKIVKWVKMTPLASKKIVID